MRPIAPLIHGVRESFNADPDLMRTVINSTSWVEASLAVNLARESVCEKQLVIAANIREALKELPRCPLSMAVDFEILARVWELERVDSGWEREFDDPDGAYKIVLLGEGNYCYDVVVRAGQRTLMWMPFSPENDFLNPDVVDLFIERSTMLANVISLSQAMGMPFSPLFYLSLEDWHQEYAETLFAEASELFATAEPEAPPKFKAGVRMADRLKPECRFDQDMRWVG